MNAEKIIKAIGNIDDRYLVEASETSKRQSPYKFAALAAASFVLIAAICFSIFALPGIQSAKTSDSAESAQAEYYAANGAASAVYTDEMNDAFVPGEAPAEAEAENMPGEPSAQIIVSSSQSASSSQSFSSAASADQFARMEDVPPGMSVATLKSVEQTGEKEWKLTLYDSEQNQFDLEVSAEAFTMPLEMLKEGTALEIYYGEAYIPVKICFRNGEQSE